MHTDNDKDQSHQHPPRPGRGQEGVDKAPGEEPNEDNIQFVQQSQKGKKVDADLSKKQDQPIRNQDI